MAEAHTRCVMKLTDRNTAFRYDYLNITAGLYSAFCTCT